MPLPTPPDPWPLPELQRARRAIVVVDVVESVRLMQEDESGFIDRWRRFVHEVRSEVLPAHGGRLVKSLGDGMLLEFASVPPAVAAALGLHDRIRGYNAGRDALTALCLRIGIHLADVVVDDLDIYGSGVNLASRLASLAGPGETVASADARELVLADFDADMEDLGDCYLKHLAAPVRAFRVWPAQPFVTRPVPARTITDDLRPTIAILPFAPYADAPVDIDIGIGDIVADQLIAALSSSPAINVISRLSTVAFRQRHEPLDRIAHALGAHFVVSGRYRVAGGNVYVHAELADARSSHVVWTHSAADRDVAVLQTDSELVAELANGISQAVFAAEVGSVRSLALPSLQSHTLLIAAISLLYRLSPIDFDRARAALDALQERAPRHAAPLAWLARWHLFRVVQGWSDDRRRDGEMALSFAKRALDRDPASSLALTMLGNVHTSFLKDLDGAATLYDQALSINPSESLAWLQKGNCLSFGGNGALALEHTEKAVELSPLDPSRHFYLSIMSSAALSAGEYERAIVAAKASMRLNGEHVSTHRVLAIAQAMTGHLNEARTHVARLLKIEPQLTVAGFVARSPGAASGLAQTFGQALHAAGLPLGE